METVIDAFRLFFRDDRADPLAGSFVFGSAAYNNPEIFSCILVRQGVGFRITALLNHYGFSVSDICFFPPDHRIGGFSVRCAVTAFQRSSDHFFTVNIRSEPRDGDGIPHLNGDYPREYGQDTGCPVFEFKHGKNLEEE